MVTILSQLPIVARRCGEMMAEQQYTSLSDLGLRRGIQSNLTPLTHRLTLNSLNVLLSLPLLSWARFEHVNGNLCGSKVSAAPV